MHPRRSWERKARSTGPFFAGVARKLNPETMKLAFIFVLVGYGTKAGLAPVHNWLPDAHSQAPSPISALLSGILLNTAFYGIMRFVMIVEPSTGSAFTGNLLIIFGLISLGISAIFILVQDNYKRLLAYSSIEHMGIISLGIGIGGPVGIYGALLHILNHALAKPLMFFASGKIQSRFGSTNIANVSGVLTSMPLLGALTIHRRVVALRHSAVQYIRERVHRLEGRRGQGSVVRGGPFPVLRASSCFTACFPASARCCSGNPGNPVLLVQAITALPDLTRGICSAARS